MLLSCLNVIYSVLQNRNCPFLLLLGKMQLSIVALSYICYLTAKHCPYLSEFVNLWCHKIESFSTL